MYEENHENHDAPITEEVSAARLSAAHGDASLPDGDAEEKEMEKALGASLASLLDIRQWDEGVNLAALYQKLQETVADCCQQAYRTRSPIRKLMVKALEERAGEGTKPISAGLYRLEPDDIAFVHAHLLFNGGVECCDGTVATHDSLLLTVAQIGVSLVAYQGSAGRWVQRMYRRDLTGSFADPMEEAMALLKKRDRKESADAPESFDSLSRIIRRSLMEYAERAVLLHRATAPWRMGHGNPVPALLLMMNTPTLFRGGIEVMRQLLLGHRKFVYVASSPSDRMARTVGDALNPLEYAVIGSLEDQFPERRITDLTDPAKGQSAQRRELRKFLNETISEIVYGVYRVAPEAPAQVFYAHKDHVHCAAAIAMADSVLQAHRGFPLLIDLADLVCRNTFDAGSFNGTVYDAYAAAGQPTRYLGERETRKQ